MREKLKKSKILIIGIIIGGIIFGGGVYAATTIAASSITYSNSGTGLSATTAQAAIDEIYGNAIIYKGKTKKSADYTKVGQNVFAMTKKGKGIGVCITYAGVLDCFQINNYTWEKIHLSRIYSGSSCTDTGSAVNCTASDFNCSLNSSGFVYCLDNSASRACNVDADGSVNCY